MIKHPLYLVPYDFSPISESALELSLDLAKANDGSVYLLNVVKNKQEGNKVRILFENTINNLPESDQKLILSNSTIGNIYEDVGKASVLLKASMIVMGTHGAKGMQKILGSHVEKMISHASSPLLITQGKKTVDKIKTIVMPINYTKESLQITKFACAMALKFNAKIHLIGQHDENDIHEDQISTNREVVNRYLTESTVDFKIVDLPKRSFYENEMMIYCKEVDADIIAITYSNDTAIQRTNTEMQKIIENKYQIPVLTVNAEDLSYSYY